MPRPLRIKRRPSEKPMRLNNVLTLPLRPLVSAEKKSNSLPTRDNSLPGKPTSKIFTQLPGPRPLPASP